MEGGWRALAGALSGAIRPVVDAIFPEHCFGCGAIGKPLCDGCSNSLVPRPRRFEIRGRTGVTAWYAYADPRIRGLLAAYKFHDRTALRMTLVDLLRRGVLSAPTLLPDAPVTLVPIPLGRKRERERGFNQASMIAQALLPHLPSGSRIGELLLRERETAQQSLLERTERRVNLREAFRLAAGTRPEGTLLLVDDVVTSGETLAAAAEALRSTGFTDVRAAAFAYATTR